MLLLRLAVEHRSALHGGCVQPRSLCENEVSECEADDADLRRGEQSVRKCINNVRLASAYPSPVCVYPNATHNLRDIRRRIVCSMLQVLR